MELLIDHAQSEKNKDTWPASQEGGGLKCAGTVMLHRRHSVMTVLCHQNKRVGALCELVGKKRKLFPLCLTRKVVQCEGQLLMLPYQAGKTRYSKNDSNRGRKCLFFSTQINQALFVLKTHNW